MTQNNVFVILYWVSDKMFNIVKIMDSLEKAYSFVCQQEKNMFYQESNNFKLLEIENQSQINEYSQNFEDQLGICFVKKGYMKLKFDKNKISDYIIISKEIE